MSTTSPDVEALMQPRILIVEDEGIVAKDLRNSLNNFGYVVCGTSTTGEDAIAKAEHLRPDLLLMDIRLRGEMDGIEAAALIRSHLEIPVVFLTAYADQATLKRASEVGPFAYVLKPFDDRELHVTLMMALCKHRAFAELDRRVQDRTAELVSSEAKFRRLQSLAKLGLFAVRTSDTDAVMERAVALVAETLDIELVHILEMPDDGPAHILRAAVGFDATLPGDAVEVPPVPDIGSVPLLRDHGAASGVYVVIHAPGPNGAGYGLMGAHSTEQREFSGNDESFLEAVANVVATTVLRARSDAKIRQAEASVQEQRVRALIAEEAVQTRDEFLMVASHELRTPVAALQLQLVTLGKLLAEHEISNGPRVEEKLERATQTVSRLTHLVEGVLDVSRLALGRLELQRERFDLGATVREVVARHEDLARSAGCELRLVAPDEPVWGSWDRTRIEQVTTNLLSNAVKFGAGHPIDIALERKGAEALVTVQDHGNGVDPADVERLLKRFERAVSPRNYGGLGLGLYIAGQVVHEHGGRIEVANGPSKGACFVVILPCEDDRGERS